ncbi:MAG TPA: AsmA family protein [Candidatus Sulfotelmatobacter sp.]|nr:AsmA family protein [Candidatus Sulfotelmatobacter sp.]
MKLFSSKRRIVAAAALIVLVLFLLRPGASRLKSRIVSSISSGVGRPVDIGSVHLRLLPRPGFDLENLVVYDDPAFGAEPMLRAGEVTADLRLTSLLRGRLEIARLDLTEPSLNLVHAESGRWNLEALLERTARIPLAPTAKAKSEPRPGFPYIEATSARINFKSGPEKKPYALTNADFSLWQDSENSWGVRLKAQPFRTDLNLNDTGLLQLSGKWQRADALRETPLQFSLEWNRAQLGQLTKFFTGNDQGWRGEVQLDVTLAGTPAKLQVTSNGSIQDFRRYDITSGRALRLAAHCDGEYSSLNHAVHSLLCSAPVGSGSITLTGDMGLPGSHSYALVLTAENVPASAAALLIERAKKNLPEDLVAGGTVRGNLRIDEAAGSKLQLEGRGEIADFRLASTTNKAEIGPETVPFLLTVGDSSTRKLSLRRVMPGMRVPDSPHVEFAPFPVGIGRTVAPTARGWVDRGGYNFEVAGEADIAKSLRIARMFGLAALQSAAEGMAQLDLQIAGSWAERSNGTSSGFTGSQVTGTAKLRDVRVAVRGAGGPVEIISADMQLLPDEVHVGKLNAKAADTSWTGSLEMPRGCGTPGACQVHFILNTNQIALGGLRDWISPHPKERPWYRVLQSSAQAGPSFLASVRASGLLIADRLQLQSLSATRVSAKVSLDTGKLQISELTADFLGGKHLGQWQADFSVQPALCNGSGSLTGVSLVSVADSMKEAWITGTANASYEVKRPCPTELWTSSSTSFWTSFSTADGTLQFEVSDGTLPRIALEEDGAPFRFTHFTGQARLNEGKVEMKDARLDSAAGKFQLSGNASLKGQLDFRLAKNQNGGAGPVYAISGTLAEPRVIHAPGSETQARLKP